MEANLPSGPNSTPPPSALPPPSTHTIKKRKPSDESAVAVQKSVSTVAKVAIDASAAVVANGAAAHPPVKLTIRVAPKTSLPGSVPTNPMSASASASASSSAVDSDADVRNKRAKREPNGVKAKLPDSAGASASASASASSAQNVVSGNQNTILKIKKINQKFTFVSVPPPPATAGGAAPLSAATASAVLTPQPHKVSQLPPPPQDLRPPPTILQNSSGTTHSKPVVEPPQINYEKIFAAAALATETVLSSSAEGPASTSVSHQFSHLNASGASSSAASASAVPTGPQFSQTSLENLDRMLNQLFPSNGSSSSNAAGTAAAAAPPPLTANDLKIKAERLIAAKLQTLVPLTSAEISAIKRMFTHEVLKNPYEQAVRSFRESNDPMKYCRLNPYVVIHYLSQTLDLLKNQTFSAVQNSALVDTPEGECSGSVYFLKGQELQGPINNIWVFKPDVKTGEDDREVLASALNIHMKFPVPTTVKVEINGTVGSAQFYIPDSKTYLDHERILEENDGDEGEDDDDEGSVGVAARMVNPLNKDLYKTEGFQALFIFDILFANTDRHGANFLFDKFPNMIYGIDQDRCFLGPKSLGRGLRLEYINEKTGVTFINPTLLNELISPSAVQSYKSLLLERKLLAGAAWTEGVVQFLNSVSKQNPSMIKLHRIVKKVYDSLIPSGSGTAAKASLPNAAEITKRLMVEWEASAKAGAAAAKK